MNLFVYPEVPRIAVGAIIIRDGKVLLVKRKDQPGKGHWAIPGGKVELGESLKDAVHREIREETGIICKALDPVYTFDYIERDHTGRVRFHYVIVDLMADYIQGNPHPADDASDARFVDTEEIYSLPVNKTTLDLLKKIHFI
jgi:8-oxo-dGTP diphosphatase